MVALRDGTDLRDNVQISLAMFREHCGLAPIANLKQCIRILVTRLSTSSETASLRLSVKEDVSGRRGGGRLGRDMAWRGWAWRGGTGMSEVEPTLDRGIGKIWEKLRWVGGNGRGSVDVR